MYPRLLHFPININININLFPILFRQKKKQQQQTAARTDITSQERLEEAIAIPEQSMEPIRGTCTDLEKPYLRLTAVCVCLCAFMY